MFIENHCFRRLLKERLNFIYGSVNFIISQWRAGFKLIVLTSFVCFCFLVWSFNNLSVANTKPMMGGGRSEVFNNFKIIMGNLHNNRLSGWRNISSSSVDVEKTYKDQETKVVILMWTKYYDKGGEDLKKILAGPAKNNPLCYENVEITIDRSRIEEATAIIFFHTATNLKRTDLPKKRRPDQLWVLFSRESPFLSNDLRPFNHLFNWTMSYRRDSEIWAPYGSYVPIKSEGLEKNFQGGQGEEDEIKIKGQSLTEWVSGKTKLLLGVISHCPTPGKREDYINLLRSEGNIPVDIFGSCGVPICPRQNQSCDHTAIWDDFSRRYKFYFAAENALCTEYITEKFWRTLQFGMVPVVYGNGNYSAVAPPGSFIDTKDFSSPKDLANYLKKLDENPVEYKKYFEWQKKFRVMSDETWLGMCRLCKAVKDFRRKLDQDPSQLPKLSHVYEDLGVWWSHAVKLSGQTINKENACSSPKFKSLSTSVDKIIYTL